MLFKSRRLRAPLQCLDSNDVSFFRGNDLKPSSGIVTRNLDRRMVEITNLQDGSVHHRHVDHMRLSMLSGKTRNDATQSVPPPKYQLLRRLSLHHVDAPHDWLLKKVITSKWKRCNAENTKTSLCVLCDVRWWQNRRPTIVSTSAIVYRINR